MRDIIELNFETEDVNADGWEQVIDTLRNNLNGFQVLYGDGDNMTISFHTHKYEVWSATFDQKELRSDDCIFLTDNIEEAKEAARNEKRICDRETTKYKTFRVEIRTNFSNTSDSYNYDTIDF